MLKPYFKFKMFLWKTCIWNHENLALKPNFTVKILLQKCANKSLALNSKCLNESVEAKPNFLTKVLLWHQTPPTESYFQIQNVCMKDLHWNQISQQNSYCETKLCQQKPCFELKMFEWMSWSETKFLNKSLAAKPNSANKIIKLKLWRKVLLRNQTPPTKVLFRIENVSIKVLIWNNRQKACCENKLSQQKLCFKFNFFELKSCCDTKFLKKSLASKPNCAKKSLVSNSKCLNQSLELKLNFQRKVLLWNQTVPTKALFWIQNDFKIESLALKWNLQKEKSWTGNVLPFLHTKGSWVPVLNPSRSLLSKMSKIQKQPWKWRNQQFYSYTDSGLSISRAAFVSLMFLTKGTSMGSGLALNYLLYIEKGSTLPVAPKLSFKRFTEIWCWCTHGHHHYVSTNVPEYIL